MKEIMMLLGSMVLSSIAFAECVSVEKTRFKCTTKRKKTIEVCDSNAKIDYAFGKAGKTEQSYRFISDVFYLVTCHKCGA